MAEGMADIHTHIIPGVDDGAGDIRMALEILRAAWSDGTRMIILTPHFRKGDNLVDQLRIENCFLELKTAAAHTLPGMELYLGREIYVEDDIADPVGMHSSITLNGSGYALVEFSPAATLARIQAGVLQFRQQGMVPILAHPERYAVLRRNPQWVKRLLELGALLQINARSVLFGNGFGQGVFCARLLHAGMVHFVASDAHDTRMRGPGLARCRRWISKRYGSDYAHRIFTVNPSAVINNVRI